MSFPRKFYCIADTHLYPGCRQRGDVLRFIWGADAPIYWLGDTLEGYRSDGRLSAMFSGDEIDRELATYIETAAIEGRIVRGNHDNECGVIQFSPDAIRDHAQGMAMAHGSSWDVWFATHTAEAQADFVGRMVYRLEQWGLSISAKLVRGLRDKGWIKRAEKWMRDRAITTLICGHVHDPEIWFTDAGTIAVCGGWKGGAPYGVIKVENGVPSLMKWVTWANEPDKPLPPEEV